MIDQQEREFVFAKLRANIPWSHIARMVGRCELDVRRDHDITFERVTPKGEPVVARAPRLVIEDPTPSRRPRLSPHTRIYAVFKLIHDANGRPVELAELRGRSDQKHIVRLRQTYGAHIIARIPEGYIITETGREVYRRHVTEAPPKPVRIDTRRRRVNGEKRAFAIFDKMVLANGAFLTAEQLWPKSAQVARNAISKLRDLYGERAIETGPSRSGYALTAETLRIIRARKAASSLVTPSQPDDLASPVFGERAA